MHKRILVKESLIFYAIRQHTNEGFVWNETLIVLHFKLFSELTEFHNYSNIGSFQ